ncbi:hypothetical protein IAR50_002052 [Cryptococcus sp. DSM 104548]
MVPPRPPLTSLHDVVLEYITVNAYASTARALLDPIRGSSSCISEAAQSGEIHSSGHGHSNDITKNGAGNGDALDIKMNAESMDIDRGDGDDEGDQEARDQEDVDHSGQEGKVPASRVVINKQVLLSIERRREILDHILNGSIEKAVQALQNHFPDVLLDGAEAPPSRRPFPNGGGPASNGNSDSRLHVSQTPHYGHEPSHAIPVFNTSSDPSHVRLNLQIQQFIESFRQMNLGSSTSSPASSISSLANSQLTNGGGGGETLTHALAAAQGLHAEAKKLKPEVRAVYMQEIKDVGALFAYENVEQSPLGGFVKQERRIRLSEQVNRAILESQGVPVESQLEEHTKRTQAIYSVLREHGVDVQPPWTRADGAAKEHVAEFWRYYGERPFSLRDFLEFSW